MPKVMDDYLLCNRVDLVYYAIIPYSKAVQPFGRFQFRYSLREWVIQQVFDPSKEVGSDFLRYAA